MELFAKLAIWIFTSHRRTNSQYSIIFNSQCTPNNIQQYLSPGSKNSRIALHIAPSLRYTLPFVKTQQHPPTIIFEFPSTLPQPPKNHLVGTTSFLHISHASSASIFRTATYITYIPPAQMIEAIESTVGRRGH